MKKAAQAGEITNKPSSEGKKWFPGKEKALPPNAGNKRLPVGAEGCLKPGDAARPVPVDGHPRMALLSTALAGGQAIAFVITGTLDSLGRDEVLVAITLVPVCYLVTYSALAERVAVVLAVVARMRRW